MFKSQHGRTYHIRAVHTNTNIREHANPEGPNQAQTGSDDGILSDLADSEHDQGPRLLAQRIEHPHLTGMCSHGLRLL